MKFPCIIEEIEIQINIYFKNYFTKQNKKYLWVMLNITKNLLLVRPMRKFEVITVKPKNLTLLTAPTEVISQGKLLSIN